MPPIRRSDLAELRRLAARKRAIDAELNAGILAARRRGHTLRAIAEASGYSFQRIYQVCKAAGIEPPTEPPPAEPS